MRDSMVFYRSYMEALSVLPEEQKRILFDAIIAYSLDDKMPEFGGVDMALFLLIKPQVDANNKRYENGKKGAESGKMGGRPPKNKQENNPEITPTETQENPTKTPPKPQNNPTRTPNVNVNVNDNVNVNVKQDKKINKTQHSGGVIVIAASEDYPRGLQDKERAERDWAKVREKLEVDLNSLSFDVWVKPLVPIGYCNESLVLLSATEGSRDEVRLRFSDKFNDTINEVAL